MLLPIFAYILQGVKKFRIGRRLKYLEVCIESTVVGVDVNKVGGCRKSVVNVQNEDKVGSRTNPCGTPALIEWKGDGCPFTTIDVRLLVKKRTQF